MSTGLSVSVVVGIVVAVVTNQLVGIAYRKWKDKKDERDC